MTSFTVVTGAAGFIGSNTVAALNRSGLSDIILVDTLGTDQKWTNLQGLTFDDIIPPDQFMRWLGQPGRAVDAIVHLGACSATTERDADYLLANNYRYSRELCEWTLEHPTRFIYASSAATYGDGSLGYSDQAETTRCLRPLNMYGYSKQLFDLWAESNQLLDRIVGLKFFNVFGPREQHKGDMRSVVHKAHGQIQDAGYLSLFKSYRAGIADGAQMRDFIYVEDAVAVILYFLERRDISGLFNCGTGVARSWLDLANAVFAAMAVPTDVRFIDMPEDLRARYQYFTQAEMGKLRETGFDVGFRSLEAGIDTYVREHLSGTRESVSPR